jgi:hypothetical protein
VTGGTILDPKCDILLIPRFSPWRGRGHEATGIHRTLEWRGRSVADCVVRTATDACDRISTFRVGGAERRLGEGIPQRSIRCRICRRPERDHRVSMGEQSERISYRNWLRILYVTM